jgi:uncharacterized membrane protein YccC
MDWPIATVLLGTLGTLALGILKLMSRREAEHSDEPRNGRVYARATDLAEFRARLVSLEQAHHVLRAEIRADIKELQATIRSVLRQPPAPPGV